MEVSRIRNIMQSYHALESGQISITDLNSLGLAHALIQGRHERLGLTSEERIKEWERHVGTVEGSGFNSLTTARESWKAYALKMREEEEVPVQAVGAILTVLEDTVTVSE